MPGPRRRLAPRLLSIALAAAQSATAAPDPSARARWSGEGVVSGFFGSRIDYVGEFRIDALRAAAAGEWSFHWQAVVPVLSTSGRGELIIDRVLVQLETGFSRRRGSLVWTPFLQGRSSERVDRQGGAGVLLAGARLGRPSAGGALDWQVDGALAVADSGLEARGSLGARGEWRWLRRPRWETGLRGSWDGLWLQEPDALRADASAGPFLRLRRGTGLDLCVHALYLRGHSPLGLEETGVLAGIEFSGTGVSPREEGEPRLAGALSVGGGQDRSRARQTLEILSTRFPPGEHGLRLRLMADNVMIDWRQNDLYYVVEGGVETASGPVRIGIDLHHRSGHLLGEDNRRRLSLNVLEVQAHTPGWHPDLPPWPEGTGWRRVTGQIAAGRVLTSEFGERRSWIARAGAQWTPPGPWRRLAPFVGARAAAGEVRAWGGSAGLRTPAGWSAALAAERDSQRLESRDTSWTLSLGRRF